MTSHQSSINYIQSIEIRNFKCLRHVSLNGLKRVNLFVGKNNAGKSSLLEALSIVSTGVGYNNIQKLLGFRGIGDGTSSALKQKEEQCVRMLSSLYSGYDTDNFFKSPICIHTEQMIDGQKRHIDYTISLTWLAEEQNVIDGIVTNRLRPIENQSDLFPKFVGLKTSYGNGSKLIPFSRNVYPSSYQEKLIPFQYVRTIDEDKRLNSHLFDMITLTPLQNHLLDALRVIDPRIKDINFLNDELSATDSDQRVPVVVLEEYTTRLRLSTMGDGINHLLTIILALLNCKGGILLIDEIENGLHYSIQKSLWQMVDKLANELDVQVFATTHSNDSIRALIDGADNKDILVVRMENENDNIRPVVISDMNSLHYAMNNNIEVR